MDGECRSHGGTLRLKEDTGSLTRPQSLCEGRPFRRSALPICGQGVGAIPINDKPSTLMSLTSSVCPDHTQAQPDAAARNFSPTGPHRASFRISYQRRRSPLFNG